MWKFHRQFALRIFVIRKINVHISVQKFQCLCVLISTTVIDNRNIKPLLLCTVQSCDDLWNIMCSGYQIDICSILFLQFQEYFCQSFLSDLKATVTNGNFPVLAETASQIASCKKDCPGTSGSRNTWFFPHMQSCPCNLNLLIHSTVSGFSGCSVYMAISRT